MDDTVIENTTNSAAAEVVEATPAPAAKPARKRAPRAAAAKKATVAKKATGAKKTPFAKKAATKKATATTTRRTSTAKAKPAASKSAEAKTSRAASAFELPRKAVLAGLGVYGKAFDQVQTHLKTLNEEIATRRSKASDLYQELVIRGEKIESEAKEKLADIDTSKFNLNKLADRELIEARIDQAKAKFEQLRKAAGINRAA
jgi:polyhydroxyalkanoate synthesis regulator phasin